MASRGEGPRRVGQVLRGEVAATSHRCCLETRPETCPRHPLESQLRQGMRSSRYGSGAKCMHMCHCLLSQSYERCVVVAPEPPAIRSAHSSQPAPAGREIYIVVGAAIFACRSSSSRARVSWLMSALISRALGTLGFALLFLRGSGPLVSTLLHADAVTVDGLLRSIPSALHGL